MIKYPLNWQHIGSEIDVSSISAAIISSIKGIGVRNLSLSGGIDSTLLLYFMKRTMGDPIHCYTVSLDENHPDFLYAKYAANFFGAEFHSYFLYRELEPDEIVRAFYNRLDENGVEDIIAGDGVDEFTCGYYSHLSDKTEQNYISWIRRLNSEHLIPLDKNSNGVAVYLPYLSPEVIGLFSLIPLYEKTDTETRKKIIVKMAQGNIPDKIINRWKYGFCDAAKIKV